MKAEVIAVGSELLTPKFVDTNSLFIAERLNEIGVELQGKTVAADDRQTLRNIVARRTAAHSAGWAMIGALASESLTFAGAVAAVALGSRLDNRANGTLLAAAGGGFLYLGWHAMNSARKREGFRAVCAPFLAGLVAIWIIALFSRH